MKKQDLLNYVADDLLDKLFGFCYARTNDSHEAEELCSDIMFTLIKTANTDGEIESVYPFIWRVARNVYADFSKNRRKRSELFYEGDSEEVISGMMQEDSSDDSEELLASVYRRIAFLTKAYREVMIMFYLEGLSTAEIAERQGASESVEEELEILRKGENGEYGLLRRLDNGKYAINFILFDKDVFEEANVLYTEQLPKICDIISNYIEEHKAEYLAFPYLNKKVDMNLILWQQVFNISRAFSENVERILEEKHFSDFTEVNRPFSVFGYVDNGKYYGGGWDGVDAKNVCGFSNVHLDNIYITRIKKHFGCGLNVAKEPQIQLALRAIEGLAVDSLS